MTAPEESPGPRQRAIKAAQRVDMLGEQFVMGWGGWGEAVKDNIRPELRDFLARLDAAASDGGDTTDGHPSDHELDEDRWESLIDGKIGALAEAAGISRDGLDWEEILGCVSLILDHLAEKAGAKANDLVAPAVAIRVAPTPPPLAVGDTVSGPRAVSAPPGTTLRCTTAAVVAIRCVNGWHTAPAFPDPEQHVELNEWQVVDLAEEET